ncbi:hypothetical protein SAMN05421780_11337 [Flexibacter flexilis DSM 6793]|uniref:Uncharacterized protein n=1 Tax=Flexibacter flexilis DSM 6793 TaxID=927664 RepID=A0A1I1NJB0_9BACT|nr:hypothetical protein SAMN05421780_11337 [Flexibacter flexilis DSM 6793]
MQKWLSMYIVIFLANEKPCIIVFIEGLGCKIELLVDTGLHKQYSPKYCLC